jgi:membrane protein implicated in regulation of membrane protease activity
MSNPSNDNQPAVPITGATLVWAIAVMFIAVLGAAVILAVALPESQNPLALVGQLLTAFAALIGVIVTLFKVSRVERKMDDQGEQLEQVQQQTNGGLHRAVRETAYDSVRRALSDHLADEEPDKPPF